MKHRLIRFASGVGLAGILVAAGSSTALACGHDGQSNNNSNYKSSYSSGYSNSNNSHMYQEASYKSSQSSYRGSSNSYNRGAMYKGRWYNNSSEWENANWSSNGFWDDNNNWVNTNNWSNNDWSNWYMNYCQRNNY